MVSPSSCTDRLPLNRSAAAGPRRADPSPACRQSSSPPAPSRAARAAPRRSRAAPRSRGPPAAPLSASSAACGATNATSRPSLATYIGSIPSSSAAAATIGETGTSASRTDDRHGRGTGQARSAPTRRRRASRRACSAARAPTASSSASTAGHSEHVSDSISASSSNWLRASMIAVPCSPIGPETSTWSPGCDRVGGDRARGVDGPDPGRAQVHLVGGAALDDLRVAGDDLDAGSAWRRVAIASTSARSTSELRPSSRIIDTVSASGRAPDTARSLTVPLTASSPIEPPGKRSGLTTKLSVVIASRAPSTVSAPASRAPRQRRRPRPAPKAGTSSPSISVCVALPPAPWASVICSSRNRGRFERAVSMISSTRCSRPVALGVPHTTSRSRAQAPVVVVRRARPLGRDHARPDRVLGRAGGAEHLAFPGLDHALQHLAALARLRIGDPHARHLEAHLGVEVAVGLATASARSAR